MTDVLVKPAFQSAIADSGDTTKLGPLAWNAARLFSAGALGDLLYRDTGSATGASWLTGAAGVLAWTGAGVAPTVTASPTLTGTNFTGIPAAAITSILETQITDGTLLARLAADETVAGSWRFDKPLGVFAAPSTNYQLLLAGTFDSATWAGAQDAMKVQTRIKPAVGGGAAAISLAPTFDIAASGINTLFTSLQVSAPTVTPSTGSGTVASVVMFGLNGTPSGGQNNYLLKADGDGRVEWGGITTMSIGGASNATTQLYLRGTYPGANIACEFSTRLQPNPSDNVAVMYFGPTIDKAASGNHTNFNGIEVAAPTITAGDASLTNATSLKIDGAPTAANNNHALWVAAGLSRFDGLVRMNASLGAFAAGDKYLVIDASGNLHISALGPAS